MCWDSESFLSYGNISFNQINKKYNLGALVNLSSCNIVFMECDWLQNGREFIERVCAYACPILQNKHKCLHALMFRILKMTYWNTACRFYWHRVSNCDLPETLYPISQERWERDWKETKLNIITAYMTFLNTF